MIKNLYAVILFSTILSAASAQTGKGHKYIGGSFFLNYDEAGTVANYTYPQGTTQYFNTGITSFNVSPEFGFFISNKWAIGIQPGYSRVSGTETSDYYSATNAADNYTYSRKYHTDKIGLALNLRYYWMLSDRFGIYPQFGISTNHDLNDFQSGSLNIGGGPNVVFFPTKKLGLNMGFGNLNYNYNYKTNGSNVFASLNNNFSFGLNYYWDK